MKMARELFQDAINAMNNGNDPKAEKLFKKVLQSQPNHYGTLNLLTIVLMKMERYREAETFIRTALQVNQSTDTSYHNYGVILTQLGRSHEALTQFTLALNLRSDSAERWNLRGAAFNNLKKYENALADFDKAIALDPRFIGAYANKGYSLHELRRYDEALACFDKALAIVPGLTEAHLGRGNVLQALGRHEEALAALDQSLSLNPHFAEAWLGRGNVLSSLNRRDEALDAFDRALTLKLLPSAWFGRGNALYNLGRLDEALDAYARGLALDPSDAEALLRYGNVFFVLKNYDKALEAYEKALSLKPNLVGTRLGLGNAFLELHRYDEALAAYDQELALTPDIAEAWLGRGHVLHMRKIHDQAAAAYAKVLKLDPGHPFVKGHLLHERMLVCDWKDADELISEIENEIRLGKPAAEPFGWQGVAKSEQSLQLCAEIYNNKKFPPVTENFPGHAPDHKTIRIGYSSGEFRNAATSSLIVGTLEHHDKSRFEIYCFDNGWDDQSEMRSRITASVHELVDIRKLDDPSSAAAVRERQIDILVNLNGYFGEERTRMFARRPAPIQVNYLGFPGTMGSTYMDYIIADDCVIPPDNRKYFTEKVVYLPNSYQANDTKKEIGTDDPSRATYGLPQQGFVFCCFNNNYKIVPEIFDRWMHILKRADGSVLWLIEDSEKAASNLRMEATARGVGAERLVFAKRLPLSEHLARHRLADLFLDTLPYNAHTTASDALWAGLPILTCLGQTFAGKVGASLLKAIGLPELITTTLDDYEELAVDLATHPEKVALLKRKSADNRLTTPLFDTKQFTRDIEAAYSAMYERLRAGLKPDHIIVGSG
jgi:predicted O-linked N-acetylglucosamine transferase (SPINDLY family)